MNFIKGDFNGNTNSSGILPQPPNLLHSQEGTPVEAQISNNNLC